MSDDVNPAAASSPAEPVLSVPTDRAQYAEWRKTGELPTTEAPATSEDSAAVSAEKSAPASEAGTKAEASPKPRRDNAETRKAELNREIRELLAQRDALKTEVHAPAKRDVAADPSPAPRVEAMPVEVAKLEAPKKPRQEEYDSWEKFDAARDEYLENLAQYKADQSLAKYKAEQEQREQQKAVESRLSEARTRYPDADQTIIPAAQRIGNDAGIHPYVKQMLNDSPHLMDVLYVMGSDEKNMNDFITAARQDPSAAIRKLVEVERLVKEELSTNGSAPAAKATPPPRDESGKFKASGKTITDAPPPPEEVSGRGSTPADESWAAVERGDFRAFRAKENRSDLERRKG